MLSRMILFNTGIPITREEAKRIVAKFSVNGTTIKYREFLRAFHSASSGATPAERLEPIIGRIREVLGRAVSPRGGASGPSEHGRMLKRAFEKFDANGNGKISQTEFNTAMLSLKVEFF